MELVYDYQKQTKNAVITKQNSFPMDFTNPSPLISLFISQNFLPSQDNKLLS